MSTASSSGEDVALSDVLEAVKANGERLDGMGERLDGIETTLQEASVAWGQTMRDVADIKKSIGVEGSPMTGQTMPAASKRSALRRKLAPGSQFSIWRAMSRKSRSIELNAPKT